MVNIYKLKFTRLQQEIIRLLIIKAGVSLNALSIARGLNVSQTAISKSLPFLEKESLIKMSKDKESKRFSIELNRENHKVIWLKRIDNFRQIYESNLVQYLYDNFSSSTIILFGSYSFGEDTYNSDIDIVIIGSKEKNIDFSKYNNILERNISLHYFKNFKEINKNLLINILNGVLLKGSIEI